MGDKTVITRDMVYEYTRKICEENNMPQEFLDTLWNNFLENDDIYTEYVWYLLTQDFKDTVKVDGVSVVDVLIWQIDHFKAQLDMDTYETKRNKATMVLRAYDTLLKMRKEPEKYIRHMQEDTGSDYPGKYVGSMGK